MTRKLIRSDWRLVQVEKGGEVIVSDIEDECKAYYLFLRAFKFGISHKVGYSLYVFNNLYLHSYCDLLTKKYYENKMVQKKCDTIRESLNNVVEGFATGKVFNDKIILSRKGITLTFKKWSSSCSSM